MSPGNQGGAESTNPTSQLGETQTRKKAVIWPKSPSELGIELRLENPWEMGWSAGRMACWAGVEQCHRQKNTHVLGNRGSLSHQGDDLAISSRYGVLGRERKWAEAVQHDPSEYRSEGETQWVKHPWLGAGLLAFLPVSRGPRESLCPTWPKGPPAAPHCPGAREYRLVQARVKEAKKLPRQGDQ